MGKARYIYFSDELDNQLKSVGNKSQLICKLLREYFRKIDLDQMSREELELFIKKEEITKEFTKKMEELNGDN